MAQGLGAAGFGAPPQGDGPLVELTEFGSNPGQLRMLEFIPDGLPEGAPLVVALHGCTQSAGGYDRGCGWSTLAAREGFALLLPEQRAANNPNRCFNWFEPADTTRGSGEAASIRRMVVDMVTRHRLDPKRVFVTGLSAGGAMTSTMLATYPEVFAAGAIIAGLPHGAANSVAEAFEAMATGRARPAAERGDAVRAASSHNGPWPRVAVWQGDADATVRPVNAGEILKQWREVHGLAGAPLPWKSLAPDHRVEAWLGRDGAALVEHHVIAGMGHGVPIGDSLGEAAPFILDVGVASSEAIAGFFGIAAVAAPKAAARTGEPVIAVGQDGAARLPERPADATPRPATPRPQPEAARPTAAAGWLGRLTAKLPVAAATPPEGEQPASGRIDPGRIIRRALKAAGLMDR